MNSGLPVWRFLLLLSVLTCCSWTFGAPTQQPDWPARYSASFGFELMVDHNGVIIVSSVDTTSQAYHLGVKPGLELMGWNTLPIRKQLELINIRKYKKQFPLMTEDNLKLMLLTRGKPGEQAQVFFVTDTGNNRGIRLTARISGLSPAASAR